MKPKEQIAKTFLGIALLTSSAMAETQTSTADAAKEGGGAAKILDKITATYVGDVFGPTLNSANQGLNAGSASVVRNTLAVGYELDNGMTVGGSFISFVPLVREKSFTLGDSYLKVAQPKLFCRGNLNVAMDARFILPLSQAAATTGMIGGLASKQVTSYTVDKTPITLGLSTFQQFNFFGGGDGKGRTVFLEFAPSMDVRITPTFAASTSMGFDVCHPRGSMTSLGIESANATWFDIGANWDIAPNLNLAPFIEITPFSVVNAEHATLNASLVWKLL